jgi:hypothetical protein
MRKNQSNQIADLIAPVNGYRGALIRKGIKPKNHHQSNLTYIKAIQDIKQPVNKPAQRSKSITLFEKNFISQNISQIKLIKVPSLQDTSEDSFINMSYGKTPEYISKIKETLETNKKIQ